MVRLHSGLLPLLAVVTRGPYNLEIVDTLELPASLQPGQYVLGWRWDCEESTQIWASCSGMSHIIDKYLSFCVNGVN